MRTFWTCRWRSIAAADYRSVSGVNCIYVETVQDPEGYSQRYWVSVETGLLVAAERLLEGETIYRMASLTADLEHPLSGSVHPAGRHGAAGYLRELHRARKRARRHLPAGSCAMARGGGGLSAAGRMPAGLTAVVAAAVTAAAPLSPAAVAGPEGQHQPDPQGRQNQKFQHGCHLTPKSA